MSGPADQPNKSVRVDIPRDPTEAIALLGKVKVKSEALGDASPLKGMEWVKIAPAHAVAAQQDSTAADLRNKAETATGARNEQMPVITQALRSARDILLGLNPGNPKKLTDFGFDVTDTPQNALSTPPVPALAAK